MSEWTLIHLDELLGVAEEKECCPDCKAGLGVHVEDHDWDVVVLHAEQCRRAPRPKGATLRLVANGDAGSAA